MWTSIKASFKGSATIVWARIQIVLGIVLANMDLLGVIDLKPVLTPKYIAVYTVGVGVVTELCRRRTAGLLVPPPPPPPPVVTS